MTKFEQITAIQSRTQQLLSGLTPTLSRSPAYGMPSSDGTPVASPSDVRLGMNSLGSFEGTEAGEAQATALFERVEAALAPLRAEIASEAEVEMAAVFATPAQA